jgi:hypothetical protein
MPEDLQEVVRETHQVPFALHLLKTAKQELPKAAAVFDLAEWWFDDCFAPSVFGSAPLGSQFAGNLLFRREVLGRTTFRSIRHLLVMFQTAGGDVRFVDAVVRFQSRHVFFAEVTGVGSERIDVFFHVDGVEIFQRLVDHRFDLAAVVGLIGDVGCDDDLLLVGHRLSFAALLEAFIRGLHDLRFGVGEVPLILRLGYRLVGQRREGLLGGILQVQ